MTYDELCDFVNMGVRKDGADAFRVKRRRPIQVQGGTIPKSVTFYCNRGRAHGDEAGRESKRNPDASSNSRAQEARRIIYSDSMFLFFCCDADASAFVVGVLGANAREAC